MKKTLVCAVASLLATGCFSGYSEDAPERAALRVRRAPFHHEMTLSGELEAARGELLTVPPLPSWQTSIKWIVEDGAMVRAGDTVVELDNSSLTSALDSRRQSAAQALQELQQREAEWSADLEQKQLEVEKKLADLEKAQIEVKVPRELVSGRAWEEKQTALRRSTTDHAKATDVLRSRQTAIDSERRNLLLTLEKTKREIALAEQAIEALVLRAPRDGIVVVKDLPWEPRKFQVGDTVYVGFALALLPDLDSIRVTATLSDVDDGKIAVGMPVTVTLDGYSELQFRGRVASIAAVAQESRRLSLRRHFEVLVSLDRLDLARMRPGLSARVIVHRGTLPGSLLVPRAALDFSAKTPRARLEDGRMKDVRIGECNALDCVVTNGLLEGERLRPVVEVTHA